MDRESEACLLSRGRTGVVPPNRVMKHRKAEKAIEAGFRLEELVTPTGRIKERPETEETRKGALWWMIAREESSIEVLKRADERPGVSRSSPFRPSPTAGFGHISFTTLPVNLYELIYFYCLCCI